MHMATLTLFGVVHWLSCVVLGVFVGSLKLFIVYLVLLLFCDFLRCLMNGFVGYCWMIFVFCYCTRTFLEAARQTYS